MSLLVDVRWGKFFPCHKRHVSPRHFICTNVHTSIYSFPGRHILDGERLPSAVSPLCYLTLLWRAPSFEGVSAPLPHYVAHNGSKPKMVLSAFLSPSLPFHPSLHLLISSLLPRKSSADLQKLSKSILEAELSKN